MEEFVLPVIFAIFCEKPTKNEASRLENLRILCYHKQNRFSEPGGADIILFFHKPI